MEAKVTYVKPRRLYVEMLARHLRTADVQEIQAIHGEDCDIEAVLTRAVRVSDQCEVGISHDTGLPTLIRGVAPACWDETLGAIWMVGTDELFRYRRNLLLEGQQYVTAQLEHYRMLFNFVDVRNQESIRWLRRLGFQFDQPTPHGIMGRNFQRFTRWRDGVRATDAPA